MVMFTFFVLDQKEPFCSNLRWVIITYKHDIYEFPHELSNDLWFRILGMFAAGRAFVPTQEKKKI